MSIICLPYIDEDRINIVLEFYQELMLILDTKKNK